MKELNKGSLIGRTFAFNAMLKLFLYRELIMNSNSNYIEQKV